MSAHDEVLKQIMEGLERVTAVMRNEAWSNALATDLTPTQGAILRAISRGKSLRLKEIAAELGVSLPTISSSVDALERKELVRRGKAVEDGRAVVLQLTDDGLRKSYTWNQKGPGVEQSVGRLPPETLQTVLSVLITLIGKMQEDGVIPLQRMCLSCRFLERRAEANSASPYFCHYMAAPLKLGDLRIECSEHDPGTVSLSARLEDFLSAISETRS